jgi:DNA (cytosine-5)-methyltransferase 1
MQRHLEARRATGKGVAADAEGGVGGGCCGTVSSKWAKGTGGPAGDECYNLIAQPTAGTLGTRGLRSHTELDGHGAYIPVAQPVPYDLFQITAPVNRQNRAPGDPCHTLARDNAAHAAVAFGTDCYNGAITGGVAATMGTPGSSVNASGPTVMQAMTVRRLTPRECERLQGFPDDWTMIPYRGKSPEDCPDGPRYKALGNSMACNCMAWIGERIAAYEAQNGST